MENFRIFHSWYKLALKVGQNRPYFCWYSPRSGKVGPDMDLYIYLCLWQTFFTEKLCGVPWRSITFLTFCIYQIWVKKVNNFKSDFLRFIKGSTRSRGYCNAFWKIWVISLKCDTVLAQWSSTRDTRAKKLTKTGDFFWAPFCRIYLIPFHRKICDRGGALFDSGKNVYKVEKSFGILGELGERA